MLPFEFVATATDSPSDSPAGSLRKFGTVVNGISGTPAIVAFCCADAEPETRNNAAHAEARYRFIGALSRASLYQAPRRFNRHPRAQAPRTPLKPDSTPFLLS